MNNKSIGKNAFANGIKTLSSVLFPLITYPYIATVLQVVNLGKYAFSYSIISYFYLIASLGISTYAIREGVKYRNDFESFSSFASEIFTVNLMSTLVTYTMLFIVIRFIPVLQSYSSTIIILSISMMFTLIGCEWVYSVFEEYVYIAIRSVVFQMISLILLFLLVKDENDVNIYAAIIVVSTSGAQIVNWIGIRKYCKITIVFSKSVWKHLLPILLLFANTLATSIYVSSDMTILGLLSGDYHAGLYSISSKVYTIVKQIMSGIIIVSIPRLSAFIGNRDKEAFKKLCSKIIDALTLIALPAMAGMLCLSEEIIIFISNETYITSRYSLAILAVSLVVCVYNWFFTSCVLIPNKKEKVVLFTTIFAAVVNIGLNFVLIPIFNENGAAITTLIAEALSLIICGIKAKSYYQLRINKRFLFSVMVGCVYVAIVCLSSKKIIESNLMELGFAIIISGFGYFGIEIVLKNRLVIETFNRMKTKMVRTKS